LADVVVCGRCGARCWATASACFNCGQAFAPRYAAYPAAGTGTAKPTGIILLAVVEAGIAVVGMFVAIGLFYWTAYRFSYDEFGYGIMDLADAAAYVVASGAGLVLAVNIWKMRPVAWQAAHVLNTVLIGMIAINVVLWGVDLLDIIGVVVNLSVLTALNLNPIRGHFGRPPLLA
jgi:hypothetical protein